MPAKSGQTLLPGFERGLVDSVKLEEFAVSLADLLFDVTIPEVSSEAERSIRVLVKGDVVRAFELNDISAFSFVFVIRNGPQNSDSELS